VRQQSRHCGRCVPPAVQRCRRRVIFGCGVPPVFVAVVLACCTSRSSGRAGLRSRPLVRRRTAPDRGRTALSAAARGAGRGKEMKDAQHGWAVSIIGSGLPAIARGRGERSESGVASPARTPPLTGMAPRCEPQSRRRCPGQPLLSEVAYTSDEALHF